MTGYRLTGPLAAICGGLAVLLLLNTGDTRLVVDASGFGPLSWPRVMLWGIVATGLLWGVSRLRDRSANGNPLSENPGEQASNATSHDNPRLVAGVFVVLLYGVTMTWIGFALATLVFLVAWFVIGGMRSAWKILANSVLGTGVLLYLFLKVAYLPLPRGIGIMDTITVGIYRFLGIY